MKYVSKNGVIHFHDTPWDTKVLNGKTLEIDFIEASNGNAKNIINQFCELKFRESYVLISLRIPAYSTELKKALLQSGFITVEHTLNVSTHGLELNKIQHILNRFPVRVGDYNTNDIDEIESISELEFNFGRFFEDPLIHRKVAQKRNKNWVRNLVNEGAIIKVLKKGDIVAGFMAYKLVDDRVNLILGGVKNSYSHLAYGFWANILFNLREVKGIQTLISSSNIDVLNLYSYFGFRFEKPQVGFHKHLQKNPFIRKE
ncbi:MAG: hypothetical protein RIG77_18195 [Cyclobacteriaceae bacterium]